MVSRFAKPQIGQTSSDSKMGMFIADYAASKYSGVKLPRLFSAEQIRGEAGPDNLTVVEPANVQRFL